jgi:riboflavin kinase/FMN adenylyltransferase
VKVIHNIEEFNPNKPVWVTQGTFDGVHIGHQKILKQVVAEARKNDGVSVLLTFYPHPRLVLYPDDNELKLLNTIDEKARLVERLGIDYMIILPFTKELSRMPAMEFVRDVLVTQLNTRKLIIGYDHRFGRNREGSLEKMIELAAIYGFQVEEIPAQDIDDSTVSSTKIRKALLSGDVQTATQYLGKNYTISGRVVEGHQQGRKLGYPTANIALETTYKLIPQNGVYAVKLYVEHKTYNGMLNIGLNPTFDDKGWSIEVHLFDFEGDLYNKFVTLELIDYVRAEEKFANKDALAAQLKKDEERIREILL